MRHPHRRRAVAALMAGGLVLASAVSAGSAGAAASDSRNSAGEEFQQTNLISNRTDQGAVVVDPNLKNPWGLAMSATSPIWVSDNNSATATLYSIAPGGATATKIGLTGAAPAEAP